MNIPTREITQFFFGLMLVFGAITLVPKAIFLFKAGNKGRGTLYLILGGASLFLSVVAFLMAFD